MISSSTRMRLPTELARQRSSRTKWAVMLMLAMLLPTAQAADAPTVQETPTLEVFVTDDGGTSADLATKTALDNWKLQKARTAKESRPAHLDPEGNWGEPSSGMQMSIRLDKSSYKVGELVNATIIMRNLEQKPKEYLVLLPFDLGFGLSLFVSGKPMPVPTKAEAREPNAFGKRLSKLVMGGHSFGLSPREQRKHELCLNWFYDLAQPGSYQIMASRDIDDPDSGGKSLISTKSAAFEIVSGNGPDNRTNASPSGLPGSPLMPPTEARQTGSVPVTSFRSKTEVPQTSEGSTTAAPSLAEAVPTTTPNGKGWMFGFLLAVIAAFGGSILWVLKRRNRRE